MTRRKPHQSDRQLRTLIAQSAARLLAEGEAADFASARRKAAERHGVTHGHLLPSNGEIEDALSEYQRIFRFGEQQQWLRNLRETALNAMALLEPFRPRLVGPVLMGSADRYSSVNLYLYTDNADTVGLFLIEHRIPYDQGECHVRFRPGQYLALPLYRFLAGDIPIELTVFPLDGERQAPLSPIDDKPMRRAHLAQLRQLLEG